MTPVTSWTGLMVTLLLSTSLLSLYSAHQGLFVLNYNHSGDWESYPPLAELSSTSRKCPPTAPSSTSSLSHHNPTTTITQSSSSISSSSMTPQSHAVARVWTQITFSIEFDAPIISHAIQHYRNLGLNPQQFLITLHHADPQQAPLLQNWSHRLQTELQVGHVHTWHGNFTSDRNNEMRNYHRKQVGVEECDWVLKFDADEFLRVPSGNMLNMLSLLGHQGFDSLSASWFDRVGPDGQLLNISDDTSSGSMEDQFPQECQFSALAGNATTRKVVAFRGYLKEKRAGHSLAKGLETCRYPVQWILDHYKWSWPVYQKLKQRMEYYKTIDGIYWWTESAAFLKHIDDNQGKIDISRPDFRCSLSTPHSGSRTMVHSFFPVEDGVAEAAACSRVRQCPNRLL